MMERKGFENIAQFKGKLISKILKASIHLNVHNSLNISERKNKANEE